MVPHKKISGAIGVANAESREINLMMEIPTREPRRECSPLPWVFLWRGGLGEAGPRAVWQEDWAGGSSVPRLHLCLCDKSISRADVLHLHSAPARDPAAPAAHLAPAHECVRARARVSN